MDKNKTIPTRLWKKDFDKRNERNGEKQIPIQRNPKNSDKKCKKHFQRMSSKKPIRNNDNI